MSELFGRRMGEGSWTGVAVLLGFVAALIVVIALPSYLIADKGMAVVVTLLAVASVVSAFAALAGDA